jgi:hypothetical protein
LMLSFKLPCQRSCQIKFNLVQTQVVLAGV